MATEDLSGGVVTSTRLAKEMPRDGFLDRTLECTWDPQQRPHSDLHAPTVQGTVKCGPVVQGW